MMRAFAYIMWKEFLQMVRTPVVIGLLILCPIVTVGFVPFGLRNTSLLRIEVVDQSPGGVGKEIIKSYGGSKHIICTTSLSEQESLKKLDNGKIDAYLTVAPDGKHLYAVIDASHTIRALDANYFMNRQLASTMIMKEIESAISTHRLFSAGPDATQYFIVTMIVLLLSIMGCCLAGLSVINEKEGKVLEHLRSTGMSASLYVSSKLVYYMAIGLVELMAGIFIAKIVFGFRIMGPVTDYILLSLCFLFVTVNLGILIAEFSKNIVQAIYVLVFLYIVLILLSTMFAPLDNLSEGWAATRFVNPFYWAVDGSWTIVLKGFSMWAIPFHYLALLAIGGVMTLLNILKIRRVA